MTIEEKYAKEGPYNYDDGNFAIWLSRFGLWKAVDREGNGICSGEDKESVVFWAREHLNGFQNSWATTTSTKFTGDSLK